MNQTHRTVTVPIPGAEGSTLTYTLNEHNELIHAEGGGRCYLSYERHTRIIDQDLARVEEITAGNTRLRHVEAAGTRWTETYRSDELQRLTHVDGVDIERDASGRITACTSPDASWRYAYDDQNRLLEIRGPKKRHRQLDWHNDALRGLYKNHRYQVVAHDKDGRRLPGSCLPAQWHRDDIGRLWTICDTDGVILHTFLWFGFACLGRIDGPVGAPMAMTFSLDPSSTPVRLIERDRVTVVSRDAFGEALLDHPLAPGLHGGCQYRNQVHYRSRNLDPTLGLYDRPDPWHGLEEDPRRFEGYRGPLPVEDQHPYAVCQHDPVSRIDPTGESSTGLAVLTNLSSFTWGMQNNVAGWLGMDWTLNFWATFITGFWQFGPLGPFFDFQGFTGERQKTFAVRRAGLLSTDRAWTLQHIIWNEADHIDEVADVNVVEPSGKWIPGLYGSIIHVDPDGDKAFLLHGDASLDGTSPIEHRGWTRAGGIGEPLYPGSNTPLFAGGGLHLDDHIEGLRAYDDIACAIQEMVPSGTFFTGNFTRSTQLTVSEDAIKNSDQNLGGFLILVTDGLGHVAIFNVSSVQRDNNEISFVITESPTLLSEVNRRARMLSGTVASSENLTIGPQNNFLNVTGVADPEDYDEGQPIRFLDPGGDIVGAGIVTGFEVSLQLTMPLPGPLTTEPFEIQQLNLIFSDTPNFTGQPDELEFASEIATPAPGCYLNIQYNGNTLIATVVNRSGAVVTLNPDLSSLGGTQAPTETANVDVLCTTNQTLGTRANPFNTATPTTLTYASNAFQSAPAANDFVLIRDRDNANEAVFQVQSVLHDVLVFTDPIPGGIGATVTAERYTILSEDSTGHMDVEGVSLETILTTPIPDGITVTEDVIRLVQYDQATFDAPTTQIWSYATSSGAEATGVTTTPTSVRPSQYVVLQQGTDREPALINTVTADLEFDRDLDMDGEEGASIVSLQTYGFAYDAINQGGNVFTIRPLLSDGTTPVQLPHFREGELVQLQGAGLDPSHIFRITGVEGHGSTIELNSGIPLATPLPAPLPSPLSIQRLRPVNPGNGTIRNAIRGRSISTNASNSTSGTFDVWNVDNFTPVPPAMTVFPLVAVIKADGSIAQPAMVTNVSEVRVTFFDPPTLQASGGTINVFLPDQEVVAYASGAQTTPDTDELVVVNDTIVPSDNPVVAMAFENLEDTDTTGALSPGTTYVPNDVDDDEIRPMELDRRQALIDHELRHTEQEALIGPWFFGFFPMAFFEFFPSIDTTSRSIFDIADTPRLQYSPYVEATIERNEDNVKILVIPEGTEVEFESEDLVQVSQGRGESIGQYTLVESEDGNAFLPQGSPTPPLGHVLVNRAGTNSHLAGRVESWAGGVRLFVFDIPNNLIGAGDTVNLYQLGPPVTFTLQFNSENRFAIPYSTIVPDGQVLIRRAEPDDPHLQRFHDVLNTFTAGGLSKFLFSLTYGGMIEFFGRLGFWFSRLANDSSKTGTVSEENSQAISVENNSSSPSFEAGNQILIQSGDDSVIRTVNRIENNELFLNSAVAFTGTVTLSPYPSQAGINAWDWHEYYNATIPDPTRPSAIQLESTGDGAPDFAPFDRIHLRAGEESKTVRVTAVDEGGVIELEEEPPSDDAGSQLRAAASSSIDRLTFDLAERDVVRIFFDPWGELLREIPTDSDWAKALVAIAKSLLSTQQWSLLPLLGYYFYDNMIPQIGGAGHRSRIEQDASEESGDLYSPLSRLRPTTEAIQRVGDIGLFWYWSQMIPRRTSTVWAGNRRDFAGDIEGTSYVDPADLPAIMPSTTFVAPAADSTDATIDPNRGTEAGAASGDQLPDMLFFKNPNSPTDPTFANTPSFFSGHQGIIPCSSRMERLNGSYVAFSTPSPAGGNHRLSVRNGGGGATAAREAQEGFTVGVILKQQPIYFDIEVGDVSISAAGQAIVRDPASPSNTLTLVVTQRAVFTVDHENTSHVVSLLRPDTGTVLRADDDRVIIAQDTPDTEPAEISRHYPFTPDDSPDDGDGLAAAMGGSYNSSRLGTHGVHLPSDIYIPVRSFQIQVVNTIPVRDAIPDPVTLSGNVNANLTTNLAQGSQGFLLVPTQLDTTSASVFTLTRGGTAVPIPADVGITIDASTPAPPELRNFLGTDGVLLTISIDDDATTDSYTVSIPVARGSIQTTITASFDVV